MEMNLIDKDIKKALKNADTVIFRLLEGNQSVIEFEKKINVEGYETSVRKSIKVGTRKQCYEGYSIGAGKRYDLVKAFTSINYASDDLKWQTVVKNLKADDEIYLEWMAGNNSNVMDRAGISCDCLHLIVKRKGESVLKFHIQDMIADKNSLARMIQLKEIF